MEAIKQTWAEWILPRSVTVVNAGLWQHLSGKVRGWCDYDPPQDAGPGVLVYHLRHAQLGEFAIVTLYAMGVQQSKMLVDLLMLPPLTPSRDEINKQRQAHLKAVIAFALDRMAEDDDDLQTLARKIGAGNGQQGKTRKGGPIPTPDEDIDKIIAEWNQVKGKESQKSFCSRKGIGVSTLSKWTRNRKSAK